MGPIKTGIDFARFCAIFDVANQNNLTLEEVIDNFSEGHTYIKYTTTAKDESGNTAPVTLTWYKQLEEVDSECNFPEVADIVQTVLQEFLPPEDRSYRVYVRLSVPAVTQQESVEKIRSLLNKSGLEFSLATDGRSIQFS